jgi:hypothetical protein
MSRTDVRTCRSCGLAAAEPRSPHAHLLVIPHLRRSDANTVDRMEKEFAAKHFRKTQKEWLALAQRAQQEW